MKKKENGRKGFVFLLLLLLLLAVTIGYSILSDTLNINGTSKISGATWKVHFTNVSSGSTGSVTPVQAPKISNDELSITYQVNLDKPGDFYEFTATVKNDGSVDAKLANAPILTGLSAGQDVYLNHTFTHLDGSRVKTGEVLEAGESVVYKVKIEFDSTILNNQLPTAEQELSLSVKMDWEQA
ncbi:MAG: hypothetical protein IKE70_05415 [Bacilli bacterium]|nr:hypothetical protein [Bacilli bacterium]